MRRLLATIAIAAASATACGGGGDPVAPPTELTVLGTYHLRLINGGPVPFRLAADGTRLLDMLSGRITLNADHTFTEVFTTRLSFVSGSPDPTETVDTSSGTWVLTASNVELTYPGEGILITAITGTQLHKNEGGFLFTFRK